MLDLARGGSHIGSALSEASQRAAIDDALKEFRQRHTNGDVDGFLNLLAEELEKRGRTGAARLVRAIAGAD
ncbi:hypothetical protein SAMN05443245_7370 [Paraburkholderia fungorum]|uniref:Uncharacterized protein n=1 Tax=Paraburkholderia fungorum TaxID=134537 RepID=A0A1H1JWN4_9BURK|nr:hypothetical protein SAMN05443245_7370 [Paraburkholderia fungorum]